MKLKLLSAVVGLQVLWILVTAASHERILRGAPTVLLRTAPVDPRDLIRGDYVVLSYDISSISKNRFEPVLTDMPAAGTEVFVLLEPDDKFHRVAKASLVPVQPVNGQRVIRGTVARAWGNESVRVDYGIEKYFVREGTGNPRGVITVEVALPDSGTATIKEVFVNGKPYREAMRNVGVR